jgi:type IV secretory pathway TraG/TraD family ATPase VirD4
MTNILWRIVAVLFEGMLLITRRDTRAMYRTAITSSLVLLLTMAILAGAQAGDDVTSLALVCVCPLSFVIPWAWPQISRAWQNRGRSTLYGSSRWGYIEEFLDWLVPQPLKRHPAPGAFPLALIGPRALELPRSVVLRHVLIFGPSGTGKTRGFIMPACAWSRGASFIAFDPKGELWTETSGNHRRAWRVAPRDPDRSICFNWVPLCQDPVIADLVARAILTQEKDSKADPFWTNAEITLLAGLFAHAGTFRTPTPAAMLEWMLNRRVLDILRELQNSPSKTAREYGGMYRHSADNERLAASIAVGGDVRLSWLLDPMSSALRAHLLLRPILAACAASRLLSTGQ